ncbi:hypothetical protein H8M03_03035 [Sphingomonas sabuli]|uniref:Uncharacterized protein n=1 Tax=Sphingomonas sabuli TaxID=2764186 RepID=A0A7G9L3Y7_9SPHN|nr:hypothetical protein [Sphingomonas sabuli]QNM83336.1 hypothetical protein H8M03_03035 [Sphingomonas sabuli]
MPILFSPRLERIDNQHDLMVAALRQAGGIDADTIVAGPGKVADVLFPNERLIVEVKSLTSNRAASSAVKQKLGQILIEHGKMIVFGEVSVPLDKVEPRAAGRMLREIGDRLRKEVRASAKQIEATAEALGWEDAIGVFAVVAPPSIMRRDLVRWIANDMLADDRYPIIKAMILASTPFLEGGKAQGGDSFLTFHARSGGVISDGLKRRIGRGWATLQGQPWKEIDEDPLMGQP